MEYAVRTFEQDKEFALMVADYTANHIRIPNKEPLYKTTDPIIQAKFPDMKEPTLRKWCRVNKKKKGLDGHYRIKLSELEKTYIAK